MPSKEDFDKSFLRFRKKLEEAIKGREQKEEWLNPQAKDKRDVAIEFRSVPYNVNGEMVESSFVIHSDCSCAAIHNFLQQAHIGNVTLAEGPKGGRVLGADNQHVKGFYCYKK